MDAVRKSMLGSIHAYYFTVTECNSVSCQFLSLDYYVSHKEVLNIAEILGSEKHP